MADEPLIDATDTPVSPEIADLQRERDDYKDRWLRTTAEFDNYRKRIERERREQADQTVVNLLGELLLIVDDFELALAVDAGRERQRRTRRAWSSSTGSSTTSCGRLGVRAIDALGADFDPNLHQAVIHEVSPDHRDGEVIGELRRGYLLNDRMLRPAMVKVAKA